jgi:hypothetical protein
MRKASGPDPQIGPLLFLGSAKRGRSFRSRAPERRGMSKSEGARAPNDRHPSNNAAAFRRPRAVALRAEGAVTSSARLRSHPMACNAGAYASGPLAVALRENRCGAPLRDGRPCVVLPPAHSLESTAPASAASFTARQADDRITSLPQPGTDVHAEHGCAMTPRVRRSAAASLIGQGCGQYAGGGEGGDKCPFLTQSGGAAR